MAKRCDGDMDHFKFQYAKIPALTGCKYKVHRLIAKSRGVSCNHILITPRGVVPEVPGFT